ncbi:MAG: hypothetical protein REI94_19475 [Moraxellaceae bacterium]|nr:hypothetical protein [Moraxellaceae bacterium]
MSDTELAPAGLASTIAILSSRESLATVAATQQLLLDLSPAS